METIFKLLVARLIQQTSELFKQLDQSPMMNDSYLLSVVFIDFKKLKPKKSLDSDVYIQIMLLYAMGWLDEFFDYINDESQRKISINFLLCNFYKYLVAGTIFVKNTDEFELLEEQIYNDAFNGRISDKKKKVIIQHGRYNAACDKKEGESSIPLALILNEWMQFKDLK
jgi:hypothetical protein